MSEENRSPTRRFIPMGEGHSLAESASGVEDNLQSQMLERTSSSEDDRRLKTVFTPMTTPLETLIQSVKELSEKNSNPSVERNVASGQSRLSGHCFHIVTAATRHPRSNWTNTTNSFIGKTTQHRYITKSSGKTPYRRLHCMDRGDGSDGESHGHMDQVFGAITDLQTPETKTKLLQTTKLVFKEQEEKYIDSEHLCLNHNRLFEEKLTKEEMLLFFLSLLRVHAIDFGRHCTSTPKRNHRTSWPNSVRSMYERTSKKSQGKNGTNPNMTNKKKHSKIL